MLKCIKLITMGQPRCETSLRGPFALNESSIAPERHRSAGSPSATYMTQIMLPATTPKLENLPESINLSGRFSNLVIDVLSLGHLTSRQDLLECILVQYGYAQLLSLGELGARFGAGDQIARLL